LKIFIVFTKKLKNCGYKENKRIKDSITELLKEARWKKRAKPSLPYPFFLRILIASQDSYRRMVDALGD